MQNSTPVSELMTVTQELGLALLGLSVLQQGDRGCWSGFGSTFVQHPFLPFQAPRNIPALFLLHANKEKAREGLFTPLCPVMSLTPAVAENAVNFQLKGHDQF